MTDFHDSDLQYSQSYTDEDDSSEEISQSRNDLNTHIEQIYGRNSRKYTGVDDDSAGDSVAGVSLKKQRHTMSKITRRVLIVSGIVLGSAAAVAAGLPTAAYGVIRELKDQANEVSDSLELCVDAVKDLDFKEAYDLSLTTCEKIDILQETLGEPVWSFAELVPVYGSDVKAAKRLIDMLSDVFDDAVVPLLTTLSHYSLETLIAKDGNGGLQFNVDGVQKILATLHEAIPTLSDAVNTLDDIGELHVSQLATVVDKAKEKISPLVGKMDEIGALLDVIPNLLAADTDRVYIIMALNNVEIRSIGGFPGQVCRVSVSNGLVHLGDINSVHDVMPTNTWALVSLSDEERYLWNTQIGYIPGDTGANPDYPRVCEIWRQLWHTYQGEYPDGFIAIDPIFMQMLLSLTDGTDLYDGTHIDGTNLVRILQHDTYWNYMYSNDMQDYYLGVAADAAIDCIFDSVSDVSINKLLKVLEQAIDEYHVLLWFDDPDVQAVVEALGVSGAIGYDPAIPELGLYFNNYSWSKMEWWLDADFTCSDPIPNSDGTTSYACTLSLTNTATWSEIYAAGTLITGNNTLKYASDDMLEGLYIFAPAGGSIEVDDMSGLYKRRNDGTYNGLQVLSIVAHIRIESPFSMEFTVTVPAEATEELSVRMTPTVQNYR